MIIFYREGGRLSVMAGCQFFWSPTLHTGKDFGPPLWPREKRLVPPKGEITPLHTTNLVGND